MRLYDGPAQGKSKTHSPSSIGNIVLPGIEHLKDMGLPVIRNPRTVIFNMHKDRIAGLLTAYPYFRTDLCVFYGVVDQIDQYL